MKTQFVCALLLAVAQPATGDVWMNGLFQSHMVLQQVDTKFGIPAPYLYGTANLGDYVTVTGSSGFPGPFQLTPASTNGSTTIGNWSVAIPTPAVNGPYTITVSAYKAKGGPLLNSIVMEDVHFGDVFVCSGQSNMVLTVGKTDNDAEEQKLADSLPNIRIFDTAHSEFDYPVMNISSGGAINGADAGPVNWTVAGNATIGRFSSVCWTAGRMLAQWLAEERDATPYIGLIQSTIGGTSVHFWAPGGVGAECNKTGGLPATGEASQHVAGWLWNGMVNPIANGGKGLSIRGAAYYQGEADSGENDQYTRSAYACELTGLMNSWRAAWARASTPFPFIIVQLPGGGGVSTGEKGWGAVQAAQADAVRDVTNAGLVMCPDQGYGGLHFPHKIEISTRLYNEWRSKAYGDSTAKVDNPSPVSAKRVSDTEFTLKLANADGLVLRESYMCNMTHTAVQYGNGSQINATCCDHNLVNEVLVHLEGYATVDHQGHWLNQSWSDYGAVPTAAIVDASRSQLNVTALVPGPGMMFGRNKIMSVVNATVQYIDVVAGTGCQVANGDGLVMGRFGEMNITA